MATIYGTADLLDKVRLINSLIEAVHSYKFAHPEEKLQPQPNPRSILNGYREGDIGFAEAVAALEELIPENANPANFFTTSQLAELLGCNIRTIYRWEDAGIIPEPARVSRGGIEARLYSAAQVEEIREKVQERISFTQRVNKKKTEPATPAPDVVSLVAGLECRVCELEQALIRGCR